MAIDNAVEGCVRETIGALVAHWQARTASDVDVRSTMKRIAADETRHAALSWSIDAWARSRLGRAARAKVADARKTAVSSISFRSADELDPVARETLGLPATREAESLAAVLREALWA